MKTYPSYDALAIDLDLHFFDKISVLSRVGNQLMDGSWFVITDDGQCYLFDENGDLDDINKITALQESFIRKDIKKIIIPDSVTHICKWLFYSCSSLTNMTIPNSVTSIERWAFSICSSLTNVIIPNSVTSIGDSAFHGCSSLTSVTIGRNVTIIGGCAFNICKNLKNLFFKGKTLEQVRAMYGYPWGIKDENIIKAELK